MVGANFQTTLEGLLLTAFRIYCEKRGCQTGTEGFRNMIRESQEFKELSVPSEMKPSSREDLNLTPTNNSSQGNSNENE